MKLRVPTSPPALEIRLFGAFELKVRSVPKLKVPAAVQSLLALLILNTKSPQSRQALATAIWPDAGDDQASFYLRRALSQLRALLGQEAVRIAADLSFDLNDCQCDLAEFARTVKTDPESAIAQYSGSLVVGKRSPRLDQVANELSERYLHALSDVAARFEAEGDAPSAIRVLRQLLTEDRASEDAWRNLIQLLGAQRDHVGAARAFRQLRLILREETGMEPQPETTALYHRVMAESDVLRVRPVQVEKPAFKSPRLPTPLTGLIGREADASSIRAGLNAGRLVFLVGLGGIGKSRLAVEIAETWSPSASVSVARVGEPDGLHDLLQMHHLFGADAAPGERLLLLIDNAENLLDALRPELEALLTEHPNLAILVTSRRSVSWPEAMVHRLSPLELPKDPEVSLAALSEVESVKLFVQRARAADSGFQFNSRTSAAVASICRKLDGLPLALELAAAKVQTMPVVEIDRRLEDRLALLTRRGSGRTLATVLAWSYEGLTDRERRLFLNLVQLPGSWSFEACEAVIEDFSLDSIESLVALDLVLYQGGRYRCLETVRDYGIRKGKPSADLRRRAAEYYFREVEARAHALDTTMDAADFGWFVQEGDNLVWTLEAAASLGDPDLVRQALVLYTHLFNFWIRSGRSSQGYRIGICLVEDQEEPSVELVAALFSEGGLALHLTMSEVADRILTRADSMAKDLGLSFWRGESLLRRADLLTTKTRLTEATELLHEALSTFEEVGDLGKQATTLRALGHVEREQGRLAESIELTRRALRICYETNDVAGQFWCLGSLGATWLQAGDPGQAAPNFLENVVASKAAGDVSTTIWNLIMLGESQKQLGNYESAAAYVREALSMYGRDQDVAIMEWPTSLLGEILTRMGDYAAAEQALERAWQYHKQAGESKLGAYTMLRRAELHLIWGKPDAARAFFEIAEELVKSSEVEDLGVQLENVRSMLRLGSARA